jgi:hypothetical protein
MLFGSLYVLVRADVTGGPLLAGPAVLDCSSAPEPVAPQPARTTAARVVAKRDTLALRRLTPPSPGLGSAAGATGPG